MIDPRYCRAGAYAWGLWCEAEVVYQQRQHIINLFIWAVSDLNESELQQFVYLSKSSR